jgi:hypothetical protein
MNETPDTTQDKEEDDIPKNPNAPIQQEELKRYLKTNLDIKALESKQAKRRQNFLDRAGLGVLIEDGSLVLKIDSNSPRVNASLILEEVAKRYGESIAKEIEKLSKKDTGGKRLSVDPK